MEYICAWEANGNGSHLWGDPFEFGGGNSLFVSTPSESECDSSFRFGLIITDSFRSFRADCRLAWLIDFFLLWAFFSTLFLARLYTFGRVSGELFGLVLT